MARRIGWCLLCLALLALAAACGVKSPPLPRSQAAPPPVRDLSAAARAQGIEISFSVPQAERPDRRVTQVRLLYAYLPFSGDPDCPPCAPRLRRYRLFHLAGRDAELMQGGRFRYLDRQAPLGKEGFYQVILIDAAGRMSRRSNLARAPRVLPPPAPTGLKAQAGDGVVHLSWSGSRLMPCPPHADCPAGWIVYRKGPLGETDQPRPLNTQPLTTPTLADKSVTNGKTYAYAVAAVRQVKGVQVQGRPGTWVQATPRDQTPPSAPTDLAGAGVEQGILLRFTPSPQQDTAGYLVYRRVKGQKDWQLLTPQPVVENTFLDREVKPRVVYEYRVQAVDEAGNRSPFSETLEVQQIID